MSKVLVLFAHPALEKSRVQRELLKHSRNIKNVVLHDLYELYPDFDIDVKAEQKLLLEHDIIIFQHPFYWYGSPAIIKQWQDLVLEHNWAYGHSGNMLAGKKLFNIISCGGSAEAYTASGRNRFTIPELLRPFEQTALLCKMHYLPPYVIFGTHKLSQEQIAWQAGEYSNLLVAIADNTLDESKMMKATYLNEVINEPLLNS
jgi:glutathione-regulated potassium-efflux system ancillary protein KefG